MQVPGFRSQPSPVQFLVSSDRVTAVRFLWLGADQVSKFLTGSDDNQEDNTRDDGNATAMVI
eukprot:scaffold4261_cov177-Alexandrium_tamarense.AAC.4